MELPHTHKFKQANASGDGCAMEKNNKCEDKKCGQWYYFTIVL